ELIGAKLAASQRSAELRALAAEVAVYNREALQRGAGDRVERTAFEYKLSALAGAVERDNRALGAGVDVLLQDIKRTLMQPFGALLEIFPKLVRDLSREQGKDIEVTIDGGHIEI